jgi:hypothetical protein
MNPGLGGPIWSEGGPNLPGWDDDPIEVEVKTSTGPITVKVKYRTEILVDGETWMAIGMNEDGTVKWKVLSPEKGGKR